ncbi:MAG: ssDNA-binding domain-containing protein [Candidatus Cyclonatronum sp.]|uniref:ArdC family protein n=1 Tax=Cyclonatronum sp. TaxID=3024185 RepID=UPI0025C063D7|nr:zincin-like metallopeptidase domain-containing protein [Cyclonatronum sp.]MCH8486903.1 ssDNA-binding domain-containing protein [Cyclonatronum sp.]
MLPELLTHLSDTQQSQAGTARYHLAVLTDLFSPHLFSHLRGKIKPGVIRKLQTFRQYLESFGEKEYDGSFVITIESQKSLIDSFTATIELEWDNITFLLKKETHRGPTTTTEYSSENLSSKSLTADEDAFFGQFYTTLKSLLFAKTPADITIESDLPSDPYKNFDNRRELYEQHLKRVADTIVKQIKEGIHSFVMPWHKNFPEAWNPVTGRYYSGSNMLILWDVCSSRNYKDNHWATMPQWRRKKATVKKGEKGTLIIIAIPLKEEELKKRAEKKKLQLTLDLIPPEHMQGELPPLKFKFARVFNADQVSNYNPGTPDLFAPVMDNTERINLFIRNTEADIRIGGLRAVYWSDKDYIEMPHIARFHDNPDFPKVERYNSVLLHELIHWTGHPTRCNRKLGNVFGSREYAFEELVAELGGAILSTEFHNQLYPRKDHASYINNWLRVLEHDFSYFTEALKLARSATYWLYQKTGIQNFDLRDIPPAKVNPDKLKEWGFQQT